MRALPLLLLLAGCPRPAPPPDGAPVSGLRLARVGATESVPLAALAAPSEPEAPCAGDVALVFRVDADGVSWAERRWLVVDGAIPGLREPLEGIGAAVRAAGEAGCAPAAWAGGMGHALVAADARAPWDAVRATLATLASAGIGGALLAVDGPVRPVDGTAPVIVAAGPGASWGGVARAIADASGPVVLDLAGGEDPVGEVPAGAAFEGMDPVPVLRVRLAGP